MTTMQCATVWWVLEMMLHWRQLSMQTSFKGGEASLERILVCTWSLKISSHRKPTSIWCELITAKTERNFWNTSQREQDNHLAEKALEVQQPRDHFLQRSAPLESSTADNARLLSYSIWSRVQRSTGIIISDDEHKYWWCSNNWHDRIALVKGLRRSWTIYAGANDAGIRVDFISAKHAKEQDDQDYQAVTEQPGQKWQCLERLEERFWNGS